jgi:hypothetical protein
MMEKKKSSRKTQGSGIVSILLKATFVIFVTDKDDKWTLTIMAGQ